MHKEKALFGLVLAPLAGVNVVANEKSIPERVDQRLEMEVNEGR